MNAVLEQFPTPDIVAHRLVHGGDWLTGPRWYRPEQQAQLDALDALAPLHNPKARQWLGHTQQRWPAAQQALVPDTGFFHQLPAVAKQLPLPRAITERFQLRRYGFHGLAHQALWRALQDASPDLAAGRVITLQLGGGCSAAALRAGVPLDTSMGFTPLAGLMMSTRPGDLDPGVILQLLTELSIAEVSTLLNQQSGLLGVSGLSADMRNLLASGSAEAAFAIESFCYRVRHYLGAYAAVLGGVDAIVFGGGIGLNSAAIRERILVPMTWLGVDFDPIANGVEERSVGNRSCITRPGSKVAAFAMAADEEQLLVEHVLQLQPEQDSSHGPA
ncbi:acetate/propionate family kinase [Permianibacter sp. IMCC34836]|uniref:acetate/propionate family kinase n=1 Tax=Permianibacter fluminis TaxID=2738515 RepID=UPI00155523F1|nr:acetate/propionate family kinase [Permianibacter fluminis]NQD37972.1 acetate/propionate family kinase [Permianibacter fluminis]